MNEVKPIYGSFSTVEVDRTQLLNILTENREKHNLIYKASVSGFYEKVSEWGSKLSEYAIEHAEKIGSQANKILKFSQTGININKEYKFGEQINFPIYPKIDCSIPTAFPTVPSFPVSYENSYNEAIKKLELSIHGTFQLSEDQFQKYVMNNWEWKNNFVSNSMNYLQGTQFYTGAYFGAISGNGINIKTPIFHASGCLENF